MAVRNLSELESLQAEVLAAHREAISGQQALGQLPSAGAGASVAVYGRVSSVVSSDPTYGPHVVVVPQQWSGTPPTASDSSAASVRCYPTPNRAVADYSVNEYVRIVAVYGAFVAEKLG